MRSSLRLVIAALVCSTAACAAVAQDYPNRAVRVLLGYGAGTGIDFAARALADRLGKNFGGTPFVIENRPGAAATIAGALVAAAPADGYTLLVDSATMTTVPSLMKNLPYHAQRDFAPVAIIAATPLMLVTAQSQGLRSVQELVAAAKAKPGSVTFGSAGVGTTTHLAAERFRFATGIQALHVPYKSTTEALADVMAGRVTFLFTSPATLIGPIKEGRLVPLAMSVNRTPLLPTVPTLAEAGIPNAATNAWFGLFAPARTPPEIVMRLHREAVKALATPEVKERFTNLGVETYPLELKEFEALLRREFAEGDQLVKAAGIRIE